MESRNVPDHFPRHMRRRGFVTFAHFTCQHRCALKDRTKENQSLGALDGKRGEFPGGVSLGRA